MQIIRRKKVGMKNFYQIGQQAVRLKLHFFVETHVVRVASVNASLAEGAETAVRGIVGLQLGVGQVLRLIVFDEPDVGMLCAVEHRLERQRYRSAFGLVGKQVVGSGIAVQPSQGAVAAGHMPR